MTDKYATHSHTLIIRGMINTYKADDLVFGKVSGEISILGVEPHDGNTLVRIDPNSLSVEAVEGRLNYWMNDQVALDNQLIWWGRNPEWFNGF